MANWRTWAAALLIGAIAVLCTSCTEPICMGPMQQGPMLELDARDWAAAHPTAQLTACLAGACTAPATGAALTAPTAEPIVIELPQGSDRNAPVQLSITATDAGDQVLHISTMITLDRTDENGPCGTISQWKKSAELTPAGALRLI